MPDNSALINAFRKSLAMVAFANGQQFPFSLDTTSALLPLLVNCVKQVNANGLAVPRDFSTSPSLQASQAVAANAGSSLKPETNQPQPAELQVEAVELASNFLMQKLTSQPAHSQPWRYAGRTWLANPLRMEIGGSKWLRQNYSD